MSKKVSLTVNRSRFNLELDDAFADFLLAQMGKDFNLDANNDVKALLHAYVKKTYEMYEQERKISELVGKVEAFERGSGK